MLSIVDLIEAGTMDRDLAGYALAAIGGGASFLVGALPGGAGKTTVMGALLNFVPAEVELGPADRLPRIRQALQQAQPRCWICHEIGPGDYYAYLWGEELRAYFELVEAGHMLATNLHADTIDQTHRQICVQNGVPEQHFRKMNLLFFLAIERGGRGYIRRISEVWESDGREAHRRVFADGPGWLCDSMIVATDQRDRAGQIIDEIVARGRRTIEQVRAAVLELREASSCPRETP